MVSKNETREKNQFEYFFIALFDGATSKNTSYLKLPNSNCFTYCIKEIMHTLRNEMEGRVKSDFSFKLIENFYDLMLDDSVLKKINYLEYSKMILTLKKYAEGGNSTKLDKYAYFESLVDKFSKQYQKMLLDQILLKWGNKELNEEEDYYLIINFINEMLANGNNYFYLGFVLKQYKEGKFEDFKSFIEYIFYGNKDSYDILLPITLLNEREAKLFELKSQKIEIIDGVNYCKVYDNRICDFFRLIKDNILRIESLFNMLRFYTNSEVDFIYKKEILVKSRYFDQTFQIGFNDIIKYVGLTPYYKNLEETIDTLASLKEKDTAAYHRVLNTISYAEKDKDIMTASSYVDNWIALETLVSMSGRKVGFESVQLFIPIILTARFILNDATNTLLQAYKNYDGAPMILERFLYMVSHGKFSLAKIKHPYYRYKLKKLSDKFSDINLLKKEFDRVEYLIKIDLIRIYILRNEYVHTSNLQAFNSMQHIKLKHILPASIDEVFKRLNMRNEKEGSRYGITFDVFSEFLNRKENRDTAFKVLLEKVRLKNGSIDLSTTLETQSINIEKFIINVLKNNAELFKTYCSTDEYEDKLSKDTGNK